MIDEAPWIKEIARTERERDQARDALRLCLAALEPLALVPPPPQVKGAPPPPPSAALVAYRAAHDVLR